VQERVTVNTGCRVTTVEFALDTDGSALGFGPPTESPPPCEPSLQDQDTKVIEALRGIESWVILSNDEIKFTGSHGILLHRESRH
jgi:heat shock protein HslJ